jgi:la-related protein 1
MVVMQLEYYLSIDNLCKDVYLRKHMDSKGFVFLSFIAAFKRIQSLTQDYELLKAACMQSDIIESVRGDDGHERLRRKEGWEKWVLAIEERDEAARHEGPSHTVPLAQVQRMQPMMGPNHYAMGPPSFSPNGMDHMYRGFPNGGVPAVNGNGIPHQPQTPLSAAVPDFAPGVLPVNGNHDPLETETTFSDEAVLKLVVVNRPKAADEVKPQNPFHSFASRTFSNGSIDEDSLVENNVDDGRQGRPLTNGNHASEQ